MLSKTIFREYDIRGIVDKEINEDAAFKIAKGFARLLNEKNVGSCIVGHDARIYSEKLKNSFVAGLLESGINVIDIGLCVTPMAYFAQHYFNVKGIAMITASHNPNGWTGFKLGYDFCSTLLPNDIKYLQSLVANEQFLAKNNGSYTSKDIVDVYVDDLAKRVKIERGLKVVVNCRNGTASIVAPKLLRKVGCKVIELFCNIDFSFPNGEPNPSIDSMLEETARAVIEHNADVGFAFDGDADRLGLVDEKGSIIYADRLLAILAKDVLKRNNGGKIVYDVKCSQVVEDCVKANKGIPIMWKTGHSYIKQKAKEENAVLAGERSGHIFIRDNYFGYDDACFAALKLLEIMQNQKLSELVIKLPKYFTSPTYHIPCRDEEKYQIVEKLKGYFAERFRDIILVNGIRVKLEDGWFLVRASSNLPALVVVFESKTRDGMEKIENFLRKELSAFGLSTEWEIS